jgi:ribosomal protein S18 acetylase RimI-like enzyme
MTSFSIRLATPDDIPHLPAIERSAAKAFLATAHGWVAEDRVTEAEAYPPLIAAGSVRIAEEAGALAGFVITGALAGGLHIYELAVGYDHQRRGIGTTLIATVREAAMADGFSCLTLTTFADVPFNAAFYARLGFEIMGAPPAHLAELLATEAARGLTQRCAMRVPL